MNRYYLTDHITLELLVSSFKVFAKQHPVLATIDILTPILLLGALAIYFA